MFMKFLSMFLVYSIFLFSDNTGLEYDGVVVRTLDAQAKIRRVIVKRNVADICKKLPLNNDMLWTGNYASAKVPEVCKSTYVHTTGKLLPMFLHEDIDTYGELEVLVFLKQMQTDSNMLLIDGRKQEWFDYRTIPGAINIPFHHLKERKAFEFEFEHALRTLGVKIEDEKPLDFTQAKTIVLFCNAPWCSQSVAMINALLNIGYPADKMSWYRGGMQDWLSAGMTSTKK
jgi:rhodanese-related sulfurtransferase